MRYRERIANELRKWTDIKEKTYNTFIFNPLSYSYKGMKKKDVIENAITQAKQTLEVHKAMLPKCEKWLLKVLSDCKKNPTYKKYCEDGKTASSGDLWAAEKAVRDRKNAINIWKEIITILEKEIA